MKNNKNKLLLAFGLFFFSIATLLAFGETSVFAATKTWDGGGPDKNFNTAANWNGDTVPQNGDTLVFPAGSLYSDTTSNNSRDLINNMTNLSVAGIQFTGAYPQGDFDRYEITGNGITVTGNLTSSTEGKNEDLNLPITLGANVTAEVDLTTLDDTLDIGSFTLTTTKAYMNINGTVSGSGSIVANTALNLGNALSDSSLFTGSITINQSLLNIARCGAFNNASGITVGADAEISLSCRQSSTDINVPLTIQSVGDAPIPVSNSYWDTTNYYPSISVTKSSSNPIAIKIKTINLGADITYGSDWLLASDTVTIQTLNRNGHTITRVPGSSGRLIVDGKDIPSQSRRSIYKEDDNGSTDWEIGDKLHEIFNNNVPNYDMTVFDGGIIGGTGTIGMLVLKSGAKLAPGMSPGCFNSSDLTFEAGAIFEAEIGGTVVCDQYDQQRVTGSVTIDTQATLDLRLINGFKPVAGNTFVIISNDGSDAVTGSFASLPEGATFARDGYVYQITYKGGDGNDVTLTVRSVPKTPNTGFGLFKNNPLATLAITSICAGIILFIAKRRRELTKI